jgi:hypothetical protein
MAFSKLDIPIKDVLVTETIGDSITKFNNNNQLLKTEIEKIVNQFELDANNKKIGTDNPIESASFKNVLIDTGNLQLQSGAQNNKTIIAELRKETNNNSQPISVFEIDQLNISESINTQNTNTTNISSSSTSSLTNVDISNKLNNSGSFIQSYQNIVKNLTQSNLDTTNNKITINLKLTHASKQNNLITLIANDTNIYDSGSWQIASGTDIEIQLEFDSNNPPEQGQVFDFSFVRIEDSSANDITGSFLNSNNINGNIRITTINNIQFSDFTNAVMNISQSNYFLKSTVNFMYVENNNTDYLISKYAKHVSFV